MAEGCSRRAAVPQVPKIRSGGKVTQIGVSPQQARTDFFSNRAQQFERATRTLAFRIAAPLANIEPVDEQNIMHVGRISRTVKFTVAQQEVKTIDTTG